MSREQELWMVYYTTDNPDVLKWAMEEIRKLKEFTTMKTITLKEIAESIKTAKTITRDMVEERAKRLFQELNENPLYMSDEKFDRHMFEVWKQLRDEAQYEEWKESQQ